MICDLKNVELLSIEEDTFTNESNGKTYPYARGTFIQDGSADTITFSIDYDLAQTLSRRSVYDVSLQISVYNRRMRHKITEAVEVESA